MNGSLLNLDLTGAVGNGGNGGISALSDDHDSGALGVLLGKACHLLGDLGNLLDTPTMGFGEGKGFSLVTNNIVGVRDDLVKGVLEEGGNERSGKGEHEGLEGKY